MASYIIQNGAFTEQKTVAATISIHTHTHAYTPILPKTPRISATIKFKFNCKNIFSDIVYNVKNTIDFALDPPLVSYVVNEYYDLGFGDLITFLQYYNTLRVFVYLISIYVVHLRIIVFKYF